MLKKVVISSSEKDKAIAFFDRINKKKEELKKKIEENLSDFKREMIKKKTNA